MRSEAGSTERVPEARGDADRLRRGSVVTGAVVVFMIAALLFYLVFAWVSIEEETPTGGAAGEAAHDH